MGLAAKGSGSAVFNGSDCGIGDQKRWLLLGKKRKAVETLTFDSCFLLRISRYWVMLKLRDDPNNICVGDYWCCYNFWESRKHLLFLKEPYRAHALNRCRFQSVASANRRDRLFTPVCTIYIFEQWSKCGVRSLL